MPPAKPVSGILVAPPSPPEPPTGPGRITTPGSPPDPPGPGAGAPGGLTTFELDCVEPKVGTPQVLTTRVEDDDTPVIMVEEYPDLFIKGADGPMRVRLRARLTVT